MAGSSARADHSVRALMLARVGRLSCSLPDGAQTELLRPRHVLMKLVADHECRSRVNARERERALEHGRMRLRPTRGVGGDHFVDQSFKPEPPAVAPDLRIS